MFAYRVPFMLVSTPRIDSPKMPPRCIQRFIYYFIKKKNYIKKKIFHIYNNTIISTTTIINQFVK